MLVRPFRWITIIFLLAAILLFWLGWHGAASYWWLLLPVLLYLHILVLGVIFIQWNFYLPAFHHGSNSNKIALTFDDGPVALTGEILDVLKAEDVKATFFCIGRNIAAHPEMLKRMVAEGHLIGNHTYTHSFSFDWQSSQNMQAELEKTNQLAKEITGKNLKWFRPPYGVTNPNLAQAVKRSGMTAIGWSLRSFDTTAKKEQQLLHRLLRRLKGGDVILLHDTMPVTAAVLTSFIQQARKRGFIFAPLDEVLSVSPYA